MAGSRYITALSRNVDYQCKAVVRRDTSFNISSPAADADLLPAALAPTIDTNVWVRAYACFSVAGKLTARITHGGATVSEIMNGDTNLIAGAAYIFDIPLSDGDTINFRYSAASGTTLRFIVDEYSG